MDPDNVLHVTTSWWPLVLVLFNVNHFGLRACIKAGLDGMCCTETFNTIATSSKRATMHAKLQSCMSDRLCDSCFLCHSFCDRVDKSLRRRLVQCHSHRMGGCSHTALTPPSNCLQTGSCEFDNVLGGKWHLKVGVWAEVSSLLWLRNKSK